MNERERYIASLTFGNPDKVSLQVGRGRESTLKRWHSEGLPEGVDPLAFVLGELGLPFERGEESVDFLVNSKMIPTFEEKILSHENGHYIVQDWMGAITEISDEYDYTYIRKAIDFVTRKWHKFPVERREDWEEMKKRYDPHDPQRFSPDLKEKGAALKNRDHPIVLNINGPFWQAREWMGLENLCMAFIDEADLVGDMMEFWAGYMEEIFKGFLPYVQPDCIRIHEDMAYKAHSMLSPTMTREYIKPVYLRWVKLIKEHGVPIIDLDCDGYIEELIPIWIESDINVCDPIEVAAGNDIARFRKVFGTKIGYSGGVDKRAIAKGGSVLEEEMNRIAPVVEAGGYIPGCDHGIPNDVPFNNYRDFVKLTAKITGWL